MRATSLFFACVVVVAGSAAARGDRDDSKDSKDQSAFRLGSSARIALLPVKCARDIDAALCSAIDESLAVDLARDPRLDILAPHDLEVLIGAQQLAELANCDREEGCFDANTYTQVEANYLLSTSIGRIGGDAMITIRLVDMKRGVVIDRDDARAWRSSEGAIDEAARALARTILVRRGVATPPSTSDDEDGGGNPVAFWGGLSAASIGAVGMGVGGVLGTFAYIDASVLKRSTGLSRAEFDATAADATQKALGADIALLVGGALVVGGATTMLVGGL